MRFFNNRLFIVLVLLAFLVTGTGCKKKHLKTIGALLAVGIAAKVIYDMVVDYRSEQTRNDKQVVDKYKQNFKELPKEPTLVKYESNLLPGSVINPGSAVSIKSSLEVVRGKDKEQVEIKEKITIYDNEDPTKELKSLVKSVNQDTARCGAFENEFTFTLPKGMPQGVYPVTTTVIIDGKELQPVEKKMQLVNSSNDRLNRLFVAAN
ncbi:MAG: hypothetical protein HWE27_18430 [Gammaproteobacteria bacterium]|nr:hypothetical protein [Gammaproteobacteria bacterium]